MPINLEKAFLRKSFLKQPKYEGIFKHRESQLQALPSGAGVHRFDTRKWQRASGISKTRTHLRKSLLSQCLQGYIFQFYFILVIIVHCVCAGHKCVYVYVNVPCAVTCMWRPEGRIHASFSSLFNFFLLSAQCFIFLFLSGLNSENQVYIKIDTAC